MPATLDVTCPSCGKALKIPAELEGKRVKCKDCQEVFQVRAPGAKAGKAAAGKPAAPKSDPPPPSADKPKNRFEDDEDDDGAPKAIGVVADDSEIPRCPHCAQELDPPDAVVCTNCGFNNRTRVKAETKKVWAPTAMDWIAHLGPGLLAVLAIAGAITLDVVCILNMRDWMTGGLLDSDEKGPDGRTKFYIPPGAFSVWITIMSLGIIVPFGKFAYRRLIVHFRPEEQVKK
jgi:hypothetical protein